MARHYRRRSYRRHRANTTWQPKDFYKSVQNIADNDWHNVYLGSLTPGIQSNDGSTVDPFDNQHVLERARGVFLHTGTGVSSDSVINLYVAAFKVPHIFASKITDADMPDLRAAEDGEDYPLFVSCVCGTGRTEPTQNLDMIDSKAKRRFDPGDALCFSMTYKKYLGPSTTDLTVSLNLRILWKLLGT